METFFTVIAAIALAPVVIWLVKIVVFVVLVLLGIGANKAMDKLADLGELDMLDKACPSNREIDRQIKELYASLDK